MSDLTFHFDRIPVETVKKIAQEFHSETAQNPSGVPGRPQPGQTPQLEVVAAESKPPQALDWRDLAERASKETDPHKLIQLVQQLCETLEERHAQRKGIRPPELHEGPDSGNPRRA